MPSMWGNCRHPLGGHGNSGSAHDKVIPFARVLKVRGYILRFTVANFMIITGLQVRGGVRFVLRGGGGGGGGVWGSTPAF